MNDAIRHRRSRNRWIACAAVWLCASLVVVGAWPWLRPWVGTSAWIWAVVGAAYHIGWLRRDRDATPD